jgi:hypothetical protein
MTIDRIENYVHTSLAGAGFVILDSQIACTLRPDLWGANGGMEAALEMARPHNRNKIAAIPGHRFLLRLQGHPRDAEVIARSDDMLDRRIQWATGMEVLDLFSMAELEGVAMVDEATTKPRAIRASDDLHHGTKTAEPGRTCSQCDRLSVNGMCMASEDSQINRPAANVLRRCKAFTPLWGSDDGRNAAQLWPEIVGAK